MAWCKGSTQEFGSCDRGSILLATAKKGSDSHMVIYGDYKEYADGCEAEAKEILKKHF